MLSDINVAIFGFGRMGQIHFQNAINNRPNVRIGYLVIGSSQNPDDLRAQFPALVSHQTVILRRGCDEEIQKVFSDVSVDALIISSPTSEHEHQIRAGLNGGKAVFVEKPLSNGLKETMDLVDLSRQMDKLLFCAFQRRFDPNFMAVKRQVEAGDVGGVHLIKSCSRDPVEGFKPGAAEFSFFVDSTVHDLNMCCWIAGERPNWLMAVGQTRGQPAKDKNWDIVSITLKFPSGIIAIIDQSRMSTYGYDQRLEVLGSKGMIQVRNEPTNHVKLSNAAGGHSSKTTPYFAERYREAYRNELNFFLDHFKGGFKDCANQATESLKLALLAEESVQTGMPVKIEW